MNPLLITIEGIQEVLAVCPCCGDVFRLAEAKFIFPQQQPKSCEYLEVVDEEKDAGLDNERLSQAREAFDNSIEDQKQAFRQKGERQAKRRLKQIDPTFSGRNIDPDDVKVIFDPIEHLIFHGMSEKDITRIEFVSREPNSTEKEKTFKSIDKALSKRNVTFETLRLREDGTFSIETE